MGSAFSSLKKFEDEDDTRPVLAIRVNKIDDLPMSYDEDQELDCYIQFTYGVLRQQSHRGQISSDPSTLNELRAYANSITNPNTTDLSKDKSRTETKTTNIKTTNNQCRFFNETITFPVLSKTARHSLEISVWDKEMGPQITDEYIGKEIIYYSNYLDDHPSNDRSNINGNSNAEYFLPAEWDVIQPYSIVIKDRRSIDNTGDSNDNGNGKDVKNSDIKFCGRLELEIEFQTMKRVMEIQKSSSLSSEYGKYSNKHFKRYNEANKNVDLYGNIYPASKFSKDSKGMLMVDDTGLSDNDDSSFGDENENLIEDKRKGGRRNDPTVVPEGSCCNFGW